MCADGAKAPVDRYGYAHALDGFVRIGREEGIKAFSKGLGPNIVRSVLMSKLIQRWWYHTNIEKTYRRSQCKHILPIVSVGRCLWI